MISETLQLKLLNELIPHGGISHAKELRAQLYALVDMALLSNVQRAQVLENHPQCIYPLISDPDLADLIPLSAHLIAPASADWKAQRQLIEQLYDVDHVSAWITSALPPEDLAQHFRQATYACDEEGRKYVLRYYDPFITPILYSKAADEWQQWFFGPLHSWWFAQADTRQEQWYQLAGYGHTFSQNPSTLIMDAGLMQALQQDPLPWRILSALEQHSPPLLPQGCRGVHLARIHALLKEARDKGMTDHASLNDYVQFRMQQPV